MIDFPGKRLPGNFGMFFFRAIERLFSQIQNNDKKNKMLPRKIGRISDAAFNDNSAVGPDFSLQPAVKPVVSKSRRILLSTRGGNLAGKNIFSPEKRNPGKITCARKLRCTVLLPSGDVLLCCNDYGRQHILGNLFSVEYSALYQSEEFLKVEKGLTDESIEILCRHCDVDVIENRARWNRVKPMMEAVDAA
jgi:hypothetical protein